MVNVHLANEKHDYGPSKRQAAYAFLIRQLRLNDQGLMKDGTVDEKGCTVLSQGELTVFGTGHPHPAGSVSGDAAVSNLLNW